MVVQVIDASDLAHFSILWIIPLPRGSGREGSQPGSLKLQGDPMAFGLE